MDLGSEYVPEADIDFTQRSWFEGALNTDGVHYAEESLLSSWQQTRS